jgi:hypothetical protein
MHIFSTPALLGGEWSANQEKSPLVHIGYDPVLAPELFWMMWKGGKGCTYQDLKSNPLAIQTEVL